MAYDDEDRWPNRLKGESDQDYGYRVGFADVILQWHTLRLYSVEFQQWQGPH